MRTRLGCFLLCATTGPVLLAQASPQLPVQATGTVPTFDLTVRDHTFTLAGRDPALGGPTMLPVLLLPVTLRFPPRAAGGRPVLLDARSDVKQVLASPVFSPFPFGTAGTTQYADAFLRRSLRASAQPAAGNWHTLLGRPTVQPITVDVGPGAGYLLSSKTGRTVAVLDIDLLEKQIFSQVPRHEGTLVIAFTHNTTYYVDGDATICCSSGTHGIDPSSGQSFVLGSYFSHAPAILTSRDVQPLTEQLAEFVADPRHDPTRYGFNVTTPGNAVPAWLFAQASLGCGGTGIASSYFLLQPTDTNRKNNFAVSPGFLAGTYHLQNVALLPWYLGQGNAPGSTYSFPDAKALPRPAEPCSSGAPAMPPSATPVPASPLPSAHKLIGYWTGHGPNNAPFALRDVSPQWDIIIVAFASPVGDAPEGTLRFRLPSGPDPAQFQAEVRDLQRRGKKVMISLGGGGVFFKLDDPAHIADFTSSVAQIISEYGFNGVDIDFETPSLVLAPGDNDFRHPTTPSVVNLIAGLRQLHDHFGPGFMISLVPEGPQLPAGFVTYGGQFGSYLPITHALRDILSFVDVQNYNTPPLEGLDGKIHQSHTVDYYAAVTELLLRGFPAGGDPDRFFPPLPAGKVAVGFLENYDPPGLASRAIGYLMTGKLPGQPEAGAGYRLQTPGGYPGLLGAMLWTIDDDRLDNYDFSNLLGPQLHAARPGKSDN